MLGRQRNHHDTFQAAAVRRMRFRNWIGVSEFISF